ncbi:MAG: hypothetical protein OES46_09975 [Gammaproteobacteria bacterium]|jgi:selenocysteine lyase/cysteine desulfurase|nr:hypothetical protein [Gammaproteobacteria bacterium]
MPPDVERARAGVYHYNTKNEITHFVQALADVGHINVQSSP